MIDQTRIQQIIKRLVKSSSVEERQAINPLREWVFGILLTLVGVFIGGGISYLSYINTVTMEVAASPVPVESANYSGTVVEEAALRFRNRAKDFASIRDAGVSAAPSAVIEPTPDSEEPPAEPQEVVEESAEPVVETTDVTREEETPQLSF